MSSPTIASAAWQENSKSAYLERIEDGYYLVRGLVRRQIGRRVGLRCVFLSCQPSVLISLDCKYRLLVAVPFFGSLNELIKCCKCIADHML